MEEMHRARFGERVQSFHALSRCAVLLATPHVHQPGSSLNPVLWVFMEAPLYRHYRLNHWPLGINSTSTPHPSPLLRNQGVGLKVPTLYSCLILLATSPHPGVGSKSHIINIKVVVERVWLWITRCPFHFYGSEVISGTEGKRPNIITKDALITLITQEIPRIWGPVSQEEWTKTKCIWEISFGHLSDQIYISYKLQYCRNPRAEI